MKIDMRLGHYDAHKFRNYASLTEFNFFEIEEQEWLKQNTQSNIKVNTPKKEFLKKEQIFLSHEQWLTLDELNSQTPFKNALSEKQNAVSEASYNEAVNRMLSLMDEITTIAIKEQGIRSELGFALSQYCIGLKQTTENHYDLLQRIKKALYNEENTEEDIMQGIDTYFTFDGKHIADDFIAFFDYISDKFENLPIEQIAKDLAIIKGWWDNNSRECLTLDDGTKLGFITTRDENGNIIKKSLYITKLDSSQMEFNEFAIKTRNFKTLLEMFNQRENLKETINSNDDNNTLQALLKDIDTKEFDEIKI